MDFKNYSRVELIEWLCINDPHGVYTDEDSLKEFGCIATRDELIEIAERQCLDSINQDGVNDEIVRLENLMNKTINIVSKNLEISLVLNDLLEISESLNNTLPSIKNLRDANNETFTHKEQKSWTLYYITLGMLNDLFTKHFNKFTDNLIVRTCIDVNKGTDIVYLNYNHFYKKMCEYLNTIQKNEQ